MPSWLLLLQAESGSWISNATAIGTLVSAAAVALGGSVSKYYASKRELIMAEAEATCKKSEAAQRLVLIEAQLDFCKEQLDECRGERDALRAQIAARYPFPQEAGEEMRRPRRPPPPEGER